MGIALKGDGGAAGVFSSQTLPQLLNLNEDHLSGELLLYYLHPGCSRVGTAAAAVPQDIVLGGTGGILCWGVQVGFYVLLVISQ